MENEKGIVKLTRKQLYDEIWAVSVAGVARKYNLNYGKLIATCKVENIPLPCMRRQKRIELYEKHVKRQNVRELKKRDAEKKIDKEKNKKFVL